MRLYLYMKFNFNQVISHRSRKRLLIHFSKYELEKYLPSLREEGYVTISEKGDIYITDFQTLLFRAFGAKYEQPWRKYKKVYVPSDFLKRKKDWKSWVIGHNIMWLANNLRLDKTKEKARKYAADRTGTQSKEFLPIEPGKMWSESTPVAQGVSLGLIQRKVGGWNISKTTASAWRRRGQIAGYRTIRVGLKVKEHFEADNRMYAEGKEAPDNDYAQWRDTQASKASRYLYPMPIQNLHKKRNEMIEAREKAERMGYAIRGFKSSYTTGILFSRNGFVIEEYPALIVFNTAPTFFWTM